MTTMQRLAAALVAATAAVGFGACIEDPNLSCADGVVCPTGFRCVPGEAGAPSSCQRNEVFDACADLADGARCSVPGAFAGSCVDGACTEIACGNGAAQPGEACDDGNTVSGDGCSSSCTSDESCGNGIVELAEECDEGAANADLPAATCLAACTLPRCGDGVITPARDEVCDDGNKVDGDGCDSACLSNETCGNGYRDPNEACDAGAANAATPDAPCRPGCDLPRCGDGVVDPGRGETCDDGNNLPGDGCTFACIVESCGNGIIDYFAGELCDDGAANSDAPDANCRPTCLPPRCGDGVFDPGHGEGCDDPAGNSDAPNATCRTDCEPSRCGDGVRDDGPRGEVCDDGGVVSGDGCSGDCRSTEVCGNEYLDAATGEQCDAGAGLSADGCASACVVEFDGWVRIPDVDMTRWSHAMAYDADRHVIVLFGGYLQGVGTLGDTWEYDGAAWIRRDLPVAPSARTNAAMAYDRARKRVVLFGGEVGFDTAADTWEYDGVAWRQIATPTTPPDRGGAAMAFDDVADRIVMFGGGEDIYAQTPVPADTWEYDGTTWRVRVPAASSPGPRREVTMGYDTQRGVLVMFGGRGPAADLAETWELSGSTWTNRTATLGASPPAQASVRTAYDPVRQRMVIGGGYGFGSQTWEYTGATWVAGASLAQNLYLGAMVYDDARARLVIQSGAITGATQEFVAGSWQDRTPAAAPAARGESAMAFDQRRGRVVLFGGWTNGPPTYFADTWEFENTSWIKRAPATSPPGRSMPAMTYDSARGAVVMFGGFDGSARGDTWRYDGATWTQVAGPGPSARYGAAMTYDPRSKRVILFGGAIGNNSRLGDTWAFDGTTWTQLAPATAPPPRAFGTLVDDARRGVLGLIGGDINDTTAWRFDGTTWAADVAPLPPPRHDGAAVAYLAERGTITQAGGATTAGYTGDTLEFDGSAWTLRAPTTILPVRASMAPVYDQARRRMLVFGGSDGGSYRGETYAYQFANPGAPADACADAAVDTDGDGLAGCADPDCWSRCTPTCLPGAVCDDTLPHCGDGACGAREDHALCPADCAAP